MWTGLVKERYFTAHNGEIRLPSSFWSFFLRCTVLLIIWAVEKIGRKGVWTVRAKLKPGSLQIEWAPSEVTTPVSGSSLNIETGQTFQKKKLTKEYKMSQHTHTFTLVDHQTHTCTDSTKTTTATVLQVVHLRSLLFLFFVCWHRMRRLLMRSSSKPTSTLLFSATEWSWRRTM